MSAVQQLTTFYIGENLYGIEVSAVQEVTGALPIIPVPLSPHYVRGLINLRGQIATAVGLRQLLGLLEPVSSAESKPMAVVCRFEGHLVSLLVDSIGDVTEVSDSSFESVPAIVPASARNFLSGVFKLETELLSLIDIQKIANEMART